MVIIESYTLAVFMCFITMLCWGSWANTQKLASREWRFPLFYWDYSIGVVLLSLVLGLTLGSTGDEGRSFFNDLQQADGNAIRSALIGGIVFNIANILLVAAIDIAGMAVAFPVGIGLALVIGVIKSYIDTPEGNPVLLFAGVLSVAVAIVLNALAYNRLPKEGSVDVRKGLVLSVVAGIAMGFFYPFVVQSMAGDFSAPEAGKLTPYSAVFIFSLGLFFSNFVWNSFVMYRPFTGEKVSYADYFRQGTPRLHAVGLLGGAIWSLGMAFSIIASGAASPAIAYGLGQGATMVAAFWGVFVWKEFRAAPAGTERLIAMMFASFIIGLGLIIAARSA
ncbi:MAG: multidrug DMT transporter permease [Pseudomonadota bacterium]